MQAFSHILSGLNCFQRLSAVDTCTFDCGHKLGLKKKNIMLTFFSSSECAHDGAKNIITFSSRTAKAHSRLHNVNLLHCLR